MDDLGLSFTKPINKLDNEIVKLGITPPNITRKKFKFHLLSCEVLWTQEMIITSDKPIENQMIRLFCETHNKDILINSNKIMLIDEFKKTKMAVIVDSHGNEISNRCLIWNVSELEMRNPDRTLDDINSLFLDPEEGWDANISKVLSYVELNVVRPISQTTKYLSSNKITDKNSKEVVISKEDFDNISLRREARIEHTLSMKILDYIQFYSTEKRISAREGEEAISETEHLSGENTINTANEIKKESLNNRNEITSYLKRLLKYYDTLALEFDNYDINYRFLNNELDIRQSISCNELSHVLISVMLVYHRLIHTKKTENIHEIINKYLIKIIGRFLLIFRKKNLETSEYTQKKIADMQCNFVTYSLLILSMSKFSLNNKILTLLVLNLLDLYSEEIDELEKVLNDYELIKSNNYSRCIESSLKTIYSAINLYLLSIKGYPPSTLTINTERKLIYKKKFGYYYLNNVISINKDKETPICTLNALFTGTKEIEEFKTKHLCRAKILDYPGY